MKFIPELAGLRGLAALMVFVAHAAADGFLLKYLSPAYGRTGLACFFILSGFLIAQVYLENSFTKENLRSYFVARIARILPVYYFVIISAFIISNFVYPGFHYDFHNKTKFLLSLLLINTPKEPWTIPVEVQFYLIFACFWFLYSRYRNSFVLILFPVVLLVPSVVYYLLYGKMPHVVFSFSLFFFIGIVISILHNKNAFGRIAGSVPKYVMYFLLLAFAVLYPALRKILGFLYTGFWYDPLALVIITSLFILIVSRPKDFGILRWKPLIFMSEISYVFYLIHRPVMKLFSEHYGASLYAISATFTVSVILAFTIYKLLEIKARAYIDGNYKTKQALTR